MSFCQKHGFEYGSPCCPMCHDGLLPDWAFGFASKKKYQVMDQLCTRDGRQIGNAIIFGKIIKTYGHSPKKFHYWKCVTDTGIIFIFKTDELKEKFYQPKYSVKNLLPYPAQKVKEYNDNKQN